MAGKRDIFSWIDVGRKVYGDEVIDKAIRDYSYEDILVQIEMRNNKTILEIVHNISDIIDKSEDIVWEELGKGVFNNLQELYPSYLICDNAYMFLKSLNDILKYTAMKVNAECLGNMHIVELGKKQAIITFHSNIGCSDLFYGALNGCEEYFNEKLYVKEINKTLETLVLEVEFQYDIYIERKYTINNGLSLGFIKLLEAKIALVVFLINILVNGLVLDLKIAVISSILISILIFIILNITMKPRAFLENEIQRLKDKKYYDNFAISTHDQFEDFFKKLRELKLEERESIIVQKGISDDMHRLINSMNSSYESINNGTDEISYIITQISRRVDENVERKEEVGKILNKNISVLKSIIEIENINKSEMEKYIEKSVKSYESIENFNRNISVALRSFRDVNSKGIEIQDGIKNISQIANMVDNIAEQVNLLSLNASIKATRVGEDGEEFIVILNSLRRLAEQSRLAGKDINDNLYKFTSDVSSLIIKLNQQYEFWEDEAKRLHEIKNMNYETTIFMKDISEALIKNINNLDREYKHIEKTENLLNEMALVAKNNSISAKEVNNNLSIYKDRIDTLKTVIESFKEVSMIFNDYTDQYKV